MSLTFKRIDTNFRADYTRLHYTDEFGQPRLLEFSGDWGWNSKEYELFAQELFQQINDILARPRPSVPEQAVPTRSA